MKTSMADIARIIGQVARLDRHGKTVVRDYLAEELAKDPGTERKKAATYQEAAEQ